MKKVFAALVIAFVSIVLMSHNTFAFDVNTLVGLPSQVGFTSMNCNAGVTCNSATNQGVFNQINVTFIQRTRKLQHLLQVGMLSLMFIFSNLQTVQVCTLF